MKRTSHLAALLATLTLAGAAQGAVLSAASGNAVTDYSSAALVSFDLDLRHFAPTRLEFELGADDLASSTLDFSALVRNLSGAGLRQFSFHLDGIRFVQQGTVTPTFGSIAAMDAGSTRASVGFGSPEYAEFYFGNPLGNDGQRNWLLDLSGLQAGDRFTITATVPEPAPLPLVLAALMLLTCVGRQRRK
ncbi:PEP-CTERM sorting domain-containing protein [Massilia sp. CF038]|uniref:PEP-CTERM sorting domain-containing protein n=1 Tax=Massilia sp. CF038 TaxID=1881045 RepID=UPI0009231DB0|nr:PEP-CTERM sorting domain-containing protein [Massilia sp. CF038]SHH51563.1 PEP-CTERM protein-sorting domain-containing protein [Massilia sp. CF038]